jgi:hypothetical protein
MPCVTGITIGGNLWNCYRAVTLQQRSGLTALARAASLTAMASRNIGAAYRILARYINVLPGITGFAIQ